AFAAVLTDYAAQKKTATESLKQPDKFKTDPWEKARLEVLAKGPSPDYVAGAAFYGACLNYEAGKFAEALPKFQAFATAFAGSRVTSDARWRAGFCLGQTKASDEAVRILQPLTGRPKLADQAFYWRGKAQLAQALATDPNTPPARNQAFMNAINSLKDATFKS